MAMEGERAAEDIEALSTTFQDRRHNELSSRALFQTTVSSSSIPMPLVATPAGDLLFSNGEQVIQLRAPVARAFSLHRSQSSPARGMEGEGGEGGSTGRSPSGS